MRSHVAHYGILALAAVAFAGCSADGTTAPNAQSRLPRSPSADLFNLATTSPLYVQEATSEESDGFGGSDLTETAFLADDFFIREDWQWTVKEIAITGALHFNRLPFSIRVDQVGHPGDVVPNGDFVLDVAAGEDSPFGGHNFLFTLPNPVTLGPGRYWLVIESGTPEDGTSLWQLSDRIDNGGVVSFDGGTRWTSMGHDYAFGVYGSRKDAQTITLAPVTPNPAAVGSTATVNASVWTELPIALAAGPATVCTLSGTTLSFVGVGTCTVTANQAGDDRYLPAPEVTQDISVVKPTQIITFAAITPNPAKVLGTATLGAQASSGLTVSYSSQTLSVCTVAGSTVSYIGAGKCTVAADQAGNTTYSAATQVTQSVDVEKNAQTITFTSAAPVPAYVNGTVTVAATGGSSGKPVVVTVASPNVCTVAGNTVTFVGVGTCTVTANQAGNDAYSAAMPVTRTLKVDYRYDGFLGAVKNDVMNSAKAGQTIALQWRVTDAMGAPITTLSTVKVTAADLNCSLGATGDQITEQAAGNSGLQNLGNGYYQYNWKSPASYAKSCKTVQLDLGEGSGVRVAKFAFSK